MADSVDVKMDVNSDSNNNVAKVGHANDPVELSPNAGRLDTAVHHITLEMTKRPIAICSGMFTFILFIVIITYATGMGALTEGTQYDWIIGKNLQYFICMLVLVIYIYIYIYLFTFIYLLCMYIYI